MPKVTFKKDWRGWTAGDVYECTLEDVKTLEAYSDLGPDGISAEAIPGEEEELKALEAAKEAAEAAQRARESAEAAKQRRLEAAKGPRKKRGRPPKKKVEDTAPAVEAPAEVRETTPEG